MEQNNKFYPRTSAYYMKGDNPISKEKFARIKYHYKKGGLISLLLIAFRVSIKPIKYAYLKLFNKTFNFQREKYYYFHNKTPLKWASGRIVEIPITMKMLNKNKDKKILEIGNVLSHYFPIQHTVIDKYEKAKDVINEDIIDFNPKTKYDFIVSISTFEHIGHNEVIKEPNKILMAIEKVKDLLNEKGKSIITIPVGYNEHLDKLLKEKMLFDKQYYLKRANRGKWKKIWKEVSKEELFKNLNEDLPWKMETRLVIGIIEGGTK